MSNLAKNASLNKAAVAKEDEFYTQLSDIEKELRHYKDYLRGKIVLCNCDDPFESNFFKFFAMNFNILGLKKLIATCYVTSPIVYTQLNLFEEEMVVGKEESGKKPYKIEITEVTDENNDGRVDLSDVEYLLRNRKNALTLLKGDGDFRSEECVELLKQADVVVTNPPFSLFREYVAQLMEYDKKFIIIGSQNALHYKEIFPLIRDNKLWLGYGFDRGNAYFRIPRENAQDYAAGVYDPNTGLVKFRNCTWFTNIDIPKRHENLILFKTYTPEEYPAYENFDAIEVGKIANIPCDYLGIMGVPDTFLYNYNPNQFEIIGLSSGELAKSIGVKKNYRGRTDLAYVDNGVHKCPFSRILIRRQPQSEDKAT